MFKLLLGYAVKGAKMHDAELKGAPPSPIMERADIADLLAEFNRIVTAPCFSIYPQMQSRLLRLGDTMRAGLAALPPSKV